ncbi:hypothetical protein AAFF_G00092050 [Aldrovandia affinis]|uniref:Uncharacterized protein n=1 Tax=Aldrovandia affinis TaxID=143900 RepID=A0AAD7T2F5_9TELE|nr:hypothetical protein AAFF_G00092050 [Aldrovandia affinis]
MPDRRTSPTSPHALPADTECVKPASLEPPYHCCTAPSIQGNGACRECTLQSGDVAGYVLIPAPWASLATYPPETIFRLYLHWRPGSQGKNQTRCRQIFNPPNLFKDKNAKPIKASFLIW